MTGCEKMRNRHLEWAAERQHEVISPYKMGPDLKNTSVSNGPKGLWSDWGDSRSTNFYDGVHVIPLRFAFAMQSDLLP